MFFALSAFAENLSLCYHKFEYSLFDLYAVLPEAFEWQIKYMQEKKLDIIRIKQITDFYDKGTGNIDKTAVITIDDGWKSVNDIIPIAVKYSAPVTLYLYKLVLNRSIHYLNYDDIAAIKASGIADFGCHSYSHIPLIKKDSDVLKREIVRAKAAIETVLAMKTDTYAYPYGMFDSATKKKVAENFKICFGVNDGWNTASTDKYNLNRFVIYKTTSFGEFKSYVDYTAGNHERGFTEHFLGTGRDEAGHFNRIKFRLFKYPATTPGSVTKTALIIPSMSAGPGWAFKLIKSLNAAGYDCQVVSGRNNYIPFYRPENEIMKTVKDWGLDEIVSDIKEVFDYMKSQNEKPVVITWGDGFDAAMSFLSTYPDYLKMTKGVMAVNPSLPGYTGSLEYYKTEEDKHNATMENKIYEASNLGFFLKVKTLMDMMILKPDEASPFAKKMAMPGLTNKELLAAYLDDQHHPEIGFNKTMPDGLMDDFTGASMQPMPLFGMVVPVAYLRDINLVWYNDYYSKELKITHAAELKTNIYIFYSDHYAENEKAIKTAFDLITIKGEYHYDGKSTVEMLLDNGLINRAVDEAGNLEKAAL
jgi:peptidoglycan/xylan/chitin deacetylase (PgdA/CDA1 family)